MNNPRRRPCVINDFDRFPTDVAASKLDCDCNTKSSALKTAQTVVCLKSYSGEKQLFICCGIVMECKYTGFGTYTVTVLTSATLLQSHDCAAKLATDLKIDVYSVGGKAAQGKVVAVDFHYNVAIVEISSDSPMAIPDVKLVDNVVEAGLSVSQHHSFRDNVTTSDRYRLFRGDKVLALARYFREPYDIMLATGEVSSKECGFDCKDLLRATCKIKKNGIGGPLVNLYGEVIGLNFYEASYTPFLPMNIVMKCFEDLKNNGHVSRPSLGVVVNDFHTRSFGYLEIVCSKFPHVVKGAAVIEVLPDSQAHIPGLCSDDIINCDGVPVGSCLEVLPDSQAHIPRLCSDDVIINCDGVPVGSCLELTELLWGKEDKSIPLVVARPSIGKELQIFVNSMDSNPKENRWPVPAPCLMRRLPRHYRIF